VPGWFHTLADNAHFRGWIPWVTPATATAPPAPTPPPSPAIAGELAEIRQQFAALTQFVHSVHFAAAPPPVQSDPAIVGSGAGGTLNLAGGAA
jgi:hypothetical protein